MSLGYQDDKSQSGKIDMTRDFYLSIGRLVTFRLLAFTGIADCPLIQF